MANLGFKQNGLRLLDSRDGDLLFADPNLNMQLLFTREFLDKAKDDHQKMVRMGERIVEFMGKHTEARWRLVDAKLEGIKLTDLKFYQKNWDRKQRRAIDDLRKLEKDIYFWETKHEKQY